MRIPAVILEKAYQDGVKALNIVAFGKARQAKMSPARYGKSEKAGIRAAAEVITEYVVARLKNPTPR